MNSDVFLNLLHVVQLAVVMELNCGFSSSCYQTHLGGLGGVVVIDAAIGVHGRGSRLTHYFTVAATLDKSLTSHCL